MIFSKLSYKAEKGGAHFATAFLLELVQNQQAPGLGGEASRAFSTMTEELITLQHAGRLQSFA